MTNKKTLYIILAIVIVAFAVVAWSMPGSGLLSFKKSVAPKAENKPLVVEENLIVPQTEKITGTESRTVVEGPVAVPLVPKTEGEKVIVAKAKLTVKNGYELANPEALKWSEDANLVFIKSLGAVTLEGKSSQWQLAFFSKTKGQKNYEIIIQEDSIVSKKEVDSTVAGADLPETWKDSDAAIMSLQELPQFSDVTISSINLYYNADGKIWRYAFSTSRGTTSTSVE